MKKLDIFLLVYKIVLLVLVVAVLAWGVYSVVDAVNKVIDAKEGQDNSASFGNALTIVVTIIISVIADAALMLLAVPGLIVSICYKTNIKRKRDIIHFAAITASPAVSFGIYYVITTVCSNIINSM